MFVHGELAWERRRVAYRQAALWARRNRQAEVATLAPGYVVTTLICAGLTLYATGDRKGEDQYWLRF